MTLRNEFTHFKGKFLGKDETPSRKVESLMAQLGVASTATFKESDVSSWSNDLLRSPRLGPWVAQKVRPFYDDALNLVLGKP